MSVHILLSQCVKACYFCDLWAILHRNIMVEIWIYCGAQQGTIEAGLRELTSDYLLIIFHLSLIMCYVTTANKVLVLPQSCFLTSACQLDS